MRSDDRVRVCLLSDAELIRCGLVQMLAPFNHRIHVVDAGTSGATDPVDVTLLNTDVGTAAGSAAFDRALHDTHAGAVVLYTGDINSQALATAMAAGCRGHIATLLGGEDLALAVEQVAVKTAMQLNVTHPLPAAGSAPTWRLGSHAGLSIRESEVLQRIGDGMTNLEIAQQLHLSIDTIKYYIRTAYKRIGVERRVEAVRWILEQPQPALGTSSNTENARSGT